MTTVRQDRLYQLLPAFYRQLDERQGQPLRALMAVLESEFRRLEEDVAAMYDDWFIETCDLWVVPYIADLLGVRHLQDVKRIPRQRRLVANSIAYRRRNGTLAVLEHVIRDATGWCARSVEFARLAASTQHVAHTRPDSGRTVDVRQLQAAAEIDGPLDTLAHTLDVDNSEQGRYHLDRIGLFLCRLRSYPIRRSFACPIEGNSGCFTFDPLGRDILLFNQPRPVVHISQRAEAFNLPLPIGRADLAADLQEHRARYGQIRKGDQPTNSRYYGPDGSLYIELPGGRPPVKPSAVVSMDLSQWPAVLSLPTRAVVAVDVELGRIAFVDQKHLPDQVDIDVEQCTISLRNWPSYVIVNYNYGFSSEVGGGPYGRRSWLDEPAPEPHHIYVAKGSDVDTLQAAFARWDEYCQACAGGKKPIGRVTILDNGLYEGRGLNVYLPRGAQLTIAAGDGLRPIIRPLTKLVVTTKPVTEEELVLRAPPESVKEEPVEPVIDRLLHLDGLVIDGGMQIGTPDETFQGKLDVQVQHCTLMPDGLGVQFKEEKDAAKLRLDIQHSIVGPLRLPAKVAAFAVRDSIVDHAGGYAIAAPASADQPDLPPAQVPGPPVTLERTTVFGKVSVQELPSASEVIFTEPVFVEKRERGGVSFSYVPAGSHTPTREFCQPPNDASASKVRPRFTSVRFGDPAYAQLGLDCPSELRRGGRDGTEMGVFCHLHRPQREINLEHILDEYLPFGMSTAIVYVT
jgi:hypothetical protein